MDDSRETHEIQGFALSLAVDLERHVPVPVNMQEEENQNSRILRRADLFALWLGNPVVKLVIRPDNLTYYQGGAVRPVSTLIYGGHVELKDNQQVSLTLHAQDAKGFDTAEDEGVTLTWASSDDSVVSVQPAADGLSCEAVAGNPGSAMVTVTDGTRTGSLAFDVTTGAVAAITVEAGTPEDQPAAP